MKSLEDAFDRIISEFREQFGIKAKTDETPKPVEFTPAQKFQIESEARNAAGSSSGRWGIPLGMSLEK
jgi:hypothetical protein